MLKLERHETRNQAQKKHQLKKNCMQTKQHATKKSISQRGNPKGNLKLPWDKWQFKKQKNTNLWDAIKAVLEVLSDTGLL